MTIPELTEEQRIESFISERIPDTMKCGGKDTIVFTEKELEFQIEENEIKLKCGYKGFELLNPKFKFEETIDFMKYLEKTAKFLLEITKRDLEDLEKLWSRNEDEARRQFKMIDEGQPLILQELEELGFNIKELKTNKPDYIG